MHFDHLDESYAMVKLNLDFDKVTQNGLTVCAYLPDRSTQPCKFSSSTEWVDGLLGATS